MTVKLNKSRFMTKIGVMYYLWGFKDGSLVIYYLGVGKEAFRRYLSKIENKSRCKNSVSLTDKKSKDIENKIRLYLDGSIKDLGLKIEFIRGTGFQKSIWKSATEVPYGKTASYKEITEGAGFTRAWRAAGSALKNNPIILAVPCHRIINKNGRISKFITGKETKRFLLDLEQSFKEK
jgi:O-6-methylguanine DNA methyltransferase